MSDFIVIVRKAKNARSKMFADDPEAIRLIDEALEPHGAHLQGIRLPSGVSGFVLRTKNGAMLPNSSGIVDEVMEQHPDLIDGAFAPPKTLAFTPGGSLH